MILMVSRLFYVCCLFYDNVQLTLHCPSHVPHFKGVLLCSFTKSWFCFGSVLEHALMLGVPKTHYFSHNLHYYNTFLPSLEQTARLVPVLKKAHLPKKRNVLWLVSCALWLVNSLDSVSILPRPFPKQDGLLYQFKPDSDPENIEQEDRAEPLHAQILQDILEW